MGLPEGTRGLGERARATARRWVEHARASGARGLGQARAALGRRAGRTRATVARRAMRVGRRVHAGASAAAAALAAWAERLAYRRREAVLAALLAASLLGGLAVERARRLWPGLLERLETEPPPPAIRPAPFEPARPPRAETARATRLAPEDGDRSARSRRTTARGALAFRDEEGGARAGRRRSMDRGAPRGAELARAEGGPRRAPPTRTDERAEARRESRRLARGLPAPRPPRAAADGEARDRRAASPPPPGEPLDLNRATAGELARLPGVGRELAGRIVAHREARGGFASPDELRWVPGVGARKLARLAPHLAGPSPAGDGPPVTDAPPDRAASAPPPDPAAPGEPP